MPTRSPRSVALTAAVERIGDRWSLLIVDALQAGPLRFGEISARVDGIAPNMLSKRLRQLETDGVVLSRPYSQRPIRVAYELSVSGRDLAGALSLLDTWGAQHGGRGPGDGGDHRVDGTRRHHAACGGPLEARLWCRTCDRPVDDPEADDNIWL